ncbi:MAG TPA: response regulator [Gemmatimonadales bacterium]|jgi:DNA-binding NtrC family response regulator
MKSVLVVDDDPGMVRTLQDILRLHGWYVDAVSTGDEAVRAVEARHYAAVLMDVRMPGMDGVAAFIQMQKHRPQIPVLLMTAYAADNLLADAVRNGVLRILPKPLDLRQTLDLLETAAEQTQAVLIVDDEVDFLKTLAGLLRTHGHSVVEATSLGDAVAVAQTNETRVILLHLHINGIEPGAAVAALRAANQRANIILYSGRPSELRAASFAGTPVVAALPKPLPIERLLGLLDDALSN